MAEAAARDTSTAETELTVHLLEPIGFPGENFTAGIKAFEQKFGLAHATIQIETDQATDCAQECGETRKLPAAGLRVDEVESMRRLCKSRKAELSPDRGGDPAP